MKWFCEYRKQGHHFHSQRTPRCKIESAAVIGITDYWFNSWRPRYTGKTRVYSRMYFHPSAGSSDSWSSGTSCVSSWHVRLSGNRFAATHHDVRRHVAAQSIAELCVMTSRGVTSRRLFTCGFKWVSCVWSVSAPASSVSRTSKRMLEYGTPTSYPEFKHILESSFSVFVVFGDYHSFSIT